MIDIQSAISLPVIQLFRWNTIFFPSLTQTSWSNSHGHHLVQRLFSPYFKNYFFEFAGVISIFLCLLFCISSTTFWIQSASSLYLKSFSHISDQNSLFLSLPSIIFSSCDWLNRNSLFGWNFFTFFLYRFRVAFFILIRCSNSSSAPLYYILLTRYRWFTFAFWLSFPSIHVSYLSRRLISFQSASIVEPIFIFQLALFLLAFYFIYSQKLGNN